MWNLYRIPWNPYEICGIHVKYVESMWNPCGILWNPYGICGIHMEYYGIHVEYVESIWIPWKELWWIPSHSTWIPEEYSMEYLNSMEFPYGMNMETYTKMAGPSAKQIPYGIHGIHMELAWIPPGICLECGGTVKTLLIGRPRGSFRFIGLNMSNGP